MVRGPIASSSKTAVEHLRRTGLQQAGLGHALPTLVRVQSFPKTQPEQRPPPPPVTATVQRATLPNRLFLSSFHTSPCARNSDGSAPPVPTEETLDVTLGLHSHEHPIVRLAYFTFDDPDTRQADPTTSTSADGMLDPSSPHYARLAKQASDQREVRAAWAKWKAMEHQRRVAASLLVEVGGEDDPEMRALAQEEVAGLEEQQEDLLIEHIRDGLLDNGSAASTATSGAIIELRPAIGGDESSVFVGEMTRMYQRWCVSHPMGHQWSVSLLSSTAIEATGVSSGALKEAIVQVEGEGAYEALKYEAGIHRVQRIPETTSVAKLQSSTMTIVVLPMDSATSSSSSGSADQPKADEIVDPADVKTEVMRSRGAGGQHVNKTESAIRLTHIPTGITISMQDSRSQHQNREKAWQILRARLLDLELKRKEQEARDVRGEQIVGLGRGDRVRTYNFPQDRVTDHRLGENVGSIDSFMEGEGEGLRYFVEGLAEMDKSLAIDERLRALVAKKQARTEQESKPRKKA